MSETMITKAALSVAAALMDGPVDKSFSFDDVNGWTQDKSYEIARAVLMAVREPDTGVGLMGAVEVNRNMRGVVKADYCAAKDSFTAMIDAILAQEPGA